MSLRRVLSIVAGLAAASPAFPQDHQHRPGMTHRPPGDTLAPAPRQPDTATLTQPGQAAFGAIAEAVAVLARDPATDWSTVNLEALRRHLMDMDDVTLRSHVVAENIGGGARFTVTGTGRTTAAIRRMARAHATMVAEDGSQRVSVEDVAGGVRLAVTSTSGDPAAVSRLRGLGFIGLLASGDHHQAHHLAIARGAPPSGHRHP